MHFTDHALLGKAARIPISQPQPVISFSPLVIPIQDRQHNLQLRVTAPTKGEKLAVIILSHGHGPYFHLSSLEGYAPLVEFWASQGFVVIQPTHLTSKFYDTALQGPGAKEIILDDRTKDVQRIIGNLDTIEKAVPFLKDRVDTSKIGIAAHSMGSLTAQSILGATNTDPRDGSKFDGYDKRVQAGVILGGVGTGGNDLSEGGKKYFDFLDSDYSTMKTPALIVWGERDESPHLTTRDAEWHNDAYRLAPGPKTSLKISNGHHAFGGISGWDAAHVQGDESPEMLGFVQRMTSAYFRSRLYGDQSWKKASEVLKDVPDLGTVLEKK